MIRPIIPCHPRQAGMKEIGQWPVKAAQNKPARKIASKVYRWMKSPGGLLRATQLRHLARTLAVEAERRVTLFQDAITDECTRASG
jgi:hypothetical protein